MHNHANKYYYILYSAYCILFSSCSSSRDKQSETILIFAASSTSELLNHVIKQYNAATGQHVILLRLIVHTGKTNKRRIPADLFISANPLWISELNQGAHIKKSVRHLVVIIYL